MGDRREPGEGFEVGEALVALVSRGAGIATLTAVWQDMMAHGLIDATLPACRADYFRFVTRGSGTGQQRWLGDVQISFTLLNWAHLYQCLRWCVPDDLYRRASAATNDWMSAAHPGLVVTLPDV